VEEELSGGEVEGREEGVAVGEEEEKGGGGGGEPRGGHYVLEHRRGGRRDCLGFFLPIFFLVQLLFFFSRGALVVGVLWPVFFGCFSVGAFWSCGRIPRAHFRVTKL
jgi:hypothetical protein